MCWINKIIGGLRVYRLVDSFRVIRTMLRGKRDAEIERFCNVEPPIISSSIFLCATGEDFVFTDKLKGILFWCAQGRENIESVMMRSYFNDGQNSRSCNDCDCQVEVFVLRNVMIRCRWRFFVILSTSISCISCVVLRHISNLRISLNNYIALLLGRNKSDITHIFKHLIGWSRTLKSNHWRKVSNHNKQ